jgi:hypothetical protein
MSHLIEEYSKNLGVKISKPVISNHFWPIVHEKYITICVDSQVPSKTYKHYDIVIDIVKKSLRQRGIKIIQIGSAKSLNLQGADQQLFDLDFKNIAYIISKSMLHIGIDNVYSHYASSINVPLVTLFGNVYESVSKGYWSKNQANIKAPWKVKPCLSAQDPNDTINKINPEEISKLIFDQLNINDQIHMKTKLIGDFYNNQIVELVPDFYSAITEIKNKHVFLRPDFGCHSEYFFKWCEYLNSFSIFSQFELNIQICQRFAQKIKKVSYLLNKDSSISETHLRDLESLKIEVCILTENEEDLPVLREKYFDFNVHLYFKASKKMLGDEVDFSDLFFYSSKVILSQNQQFSCKYNFLQGRNSLDKNNNLVENEDLLAELHHFYIYEKTNGSK